MLLTPGRNRVQNANGSRGGRSRKPTCEGLEGRALLATAALDPSFGQGGLLLGPVISGTTVTAALPPSALAVQPDGKLVTVREDLVPTTGSTIEGSQGLALGFRRFNPDGSPDPTFGNAGVLEVPLPGTDSFAALPRNLVIDTNRNIVVAAALRQTDVNGNITPVVPGSLIVRLTSAGRLDSTFGTQGEFAVSLPSAKFNTVALESDNRIVAAGTTAGVDAAGRTDSQTSVIRLTTAGTLDPTFGSSGVVANLPGTFYSTTPPDTITGVALAPTARNPSGEILVARTRLSFSGDVTVATTILTELNSDGTPNTAFGTAGTITNPISLLAGNPQASFNDLVVENTNNDKILLGAVNLGSDGYNHLDLVQLLADGTVDPTFQSAAAASARWSSADSSVRIAIGSGAAPEITVAGVTADQARFQVERYLASGALDTTFGTNGTSTFAVSPPTPSSSSRTGPASSTSSLANLALTPAGKVIVSGQAVTSVVDTRGYFLANSQKVLAQVLVTPATITPTKPATPGDYDGDGKADIAAELASFGLFAIRQSSGKGDLLAPFGPAGLGGTIPAPGDYDGDGKTDIAAYLPAYGVLAYRPSAGGADVIVPFGIPGAGQSIPAPGDYDGDGKTDVAVYLPTLGILAYRPSRGGTDVLIPFGASGSGQSVPAPGDYDGDGKTDPAVYLPSFGILAYRPSSGGADVLVPFGLAGAGQTIPAPGDYDGDGKTDVAAYLPSLGVFAYRPSSGGADLIEPFGIAGVGVSIPAPGDYDGDGKTDIAVFIPALGDFAYRPSSGGADVIEPFGITGPGQTVLANSIAYGQPGITTSGTVAAQAIGGAIPVSAEILGTPVALTHPKRKKH